MSSQNNYYKQMKYLKNVLGVFLFVAPFILSSQSLLWEISKPNIKKHSYIYGTIHIQDKRVFEYSDSVEIAIKACDAFALEILLDEIDPKSLLKAMTMNTTLDKLLSTEEYDFVKNEVKKRYGLNILMFNKIKPFFTSTQLMISNSNKEMEDALDPHLLKIARNLNKKCVGIETFQDQIDAVDKISLKEQAKMLMSGLKDTSTTDLKSNDLIESYLKMDINEMVELTKDTTMPKVFEEVFIWKRNVRMANSIDKQIKKQSIFVAIGAAHLGGEKGVLQYLRNKGYSVRPVSMKFIKKEVEIKN